MNKARRLLVRFSMSHYVHLISVLLLLATVGFVAFSYGERRETGRNKTQDVPQTAITFHGHNVAQWRLFLDSEDPDERRQAIVALAQLDNQGQQLVPLIRQGLTDDAPAPRIAALELIPALTDPPGDLLPMLLEMTQYEDERLVVAAIDAIACYGDDPDVAARVVQLLDNPADQIRLAAIRALGSVKDPQTVPLLTEYLIEKRDERTIDSKLRATAVLALAKLGEKAKPAMPQIVELFSSEQLLLDLESEMESVDYLASFGKTVVPTLIMQLEGDQAAWVKTQALVVLQRIVTLHRREGRLPRELKEQVHTAIGLGLDQRRQLAEDADELERADVRQADESVRIAALDALRACGEDGKAMINKLAARIKSIPADLRPRYVETLVAIGAEPEMVVNKTLEALYASPGHELRYRRLIQEKVGVAAVPLLKRAEQDQDPRISQWTRRTLQDLEGVYSWHSIEKLNRRAAGN